MVVAIVLEKTRTAICQSCGMPMKRTEDFGTNRAGSVNNEYCSFCFRAGQFTDEGISLEQKIAKNIMIAKTMGIPENQARQMAENIIPKLKRWRKNEWKIPLNKNLKENRCAYLEFRNRHIFWPTF